MTDPLKAFATVDPFDGMNAKSPGRLANLVNGRWMTGSTFRDDLPDPMTGERFLDVPDTTDFAPFIEGLRACPKSGLHNPLKNNERYVHLGRVCAKAAAS